MSKTFSQMLIERGVKPGNKMYSKVRPRGLYMLLPSMWRKAKLIEKVNDYSYERLMLQHDTAIAKWRLSQQDTRSTQTPTKGDQENATPHQPQRGGKRV